MKNSVIVLAMISMKDRKLRIRKYFLGAVILQGHHKTM